MREGAFWSEVGRCGPDDCWPWLGPRDRLGYGRYRHTDTHGSRLAHRIAFEIAAGRPIGLGLCVLHRCDNPPCCNPAHLFEGTKAENTADMMRKGRNGYRVHRGDEHWSRLHPELRVRGERNGCSKLTAAQVLEIRRRFAAGGVSKSALGREYGVSAFNIYQIVKRLKWKDLPDSEVA